jgi:heme o synthase
MNARAYLSLTKPGITLFIGITAAAGYVTALGGLVMPVRFVIALVSTMLMSGGAATLNQVAEFGRDALMRRTSRRPLPAGVITPGRARVFAWTLTTSGLLLALAFLPWQAALFLVVCHISYVNIYTPLKRRTPLCTLMGAIPGSVPVLAGWAATGEPIGVAALALTGVVFMWQIPHFLAIGWMGRDDYSVAGCPMLGVVDATGRSSARVSFAYAGAMLVCAVMVGLTSPAGSLYMNIALIACGGYMLFAWRFLQQRERVPARRLFFSSLIVMPLLLGALIADLVLL